MENYDCQSPMPNTNSMRFLKFEGLPKTQIPNFEKLTPDVVYFDQWTGASHVICQTKSFFLHFNIFFQRAIWLYVRLYCWDQNSRLPRPFFKGFLLFFFFLLQNKKSMQRAEKSISTSYQVCKHLKRGQNTQQINN